MSVSRALFNFANYVTHKRGLAKKEKIPSRPAWWLKAVSRPVIRTDISPLADTNSVETDKDKVLRLLDHSIDSLVKAGGEDHVLEILGEARTSFSLTGQVCESKNLPCSCTHNIDCDSGTVTGISVRYSPSYVRLFWDERENSYPYPLNIFASYSLKEGVYVYNFNHDRERVNQIAGQTAADLLNLSEEAGSIDSLKCSKEEKEQFLNRMYNVSKRYLAAIAYTEYLGYKEMSEFLYRQGINAYTACSLKEYKSMPDDMAKSLLILMRKVKPDGKVDEESLRELVIGNHIYYRQKYPSFDGGAIRCAYEVLTSFYPGGDKLQKSEEPEFKTWLLNELMGVKF